MSDATVPNKPCPFCGGADPEYWEDDGGMPYGDQVVCPTCQASGPAVGPPETPISSDRKKAAWDAWNRRLGDRCAGGCEEGDFTPWLGIDPAGPPS